MERDLLKDKSKINKYWNKEIIDDGEDIADILNIATHSIDRAIAAEIKLKSIEKTQES